MVCLTPYALDHPLEITPEQYEQLVRRVQNGWSFCDTREECLAKLYYLREGLQNGKIDNETFLEKEKMLVINWWKR